MVETSVVLFTAAGAILDRFLAELYRMD